MLILSRKIGEELIIGEDGEVKIKVLSRRGRQVRLGIEAPKGVPVNRKEIYDKIQEEVGIDATVAKTGDNET